MTENEIGTIVVAATIAVHSALGPGLLESVYEAVLASELAERGLNAQRQIPVPISYRGTVFDEGFRADIVVEGRVILELLEKVNRTYGTTVVIVSHNAAIGGMGMRVATMSSGRIANWVAHPAPVPPGEIEW